MNQLDFEVKGQGHRETTYGQLSTLGGIFLPSCRLHGYILMQLISYSLPSPCDTGDILKVMGSKVKVTDNFPHRRFTIEDHPVVAL